MAITTAFHTTTPGAPRWCGLALAALTTLGACGGKHAATTPVADEHDGDGDSEQGGGTADSTDTGMIPPEIMDGITETLDRKRTIVARCLGDAIEAGSAAKNAHGKVALEFVVTPEGKAKQVKVVRSTVKSEAVEACVAEKVGQMTFPKPPKDLDWSYTYALESN
jgi:hypothetical protein